MDADSGIGAGSQHLQDKLDYHMLRVDIRFMDFLLTLQSIKQNPSKSRLLS